MSERWGCEIVDAQIHLWRADTPERPWPEYGRGHEHGPELLAPELLARMDRAGIDRAVLVPPSWEGDRNDTCLEAAAAHPDRFRVMGRFPVERRERAGELEGWLEQPGMLGIRLTFHRDFQRRWLREGAVDWFWAEAERLGIPLMVLVPGSVPELGRVAERHPGLRLVLDHLAMMEDVGGRLLETLEPVLALARYPNVAAKATCLPNLVSEPCPFPTLQEVVRRVVDAYGPERTFWGTDLSRLRVPPEEAIALFTEACGFLGPRELEWVMGRGVREWLGWETD